MDRNSCIAHTQMTEVLSLKHIQNGKITTTYFASVNKNMGKTDLLVFMKKYEGLQ